MQPEQFDPARHRMFEVEETRYYRYYVVAEDADAATDLANRLSDDEASEGADFVATELLVNPPASEADKRPEGPACWGRRRLTVHQALDLIRHPEPVPAMVATDQLRRLDDWDWVRLASSAEPWTDARGLPATLALHAVQVRCGLAAATDGMRMHVAPVRLRTGLWDAETEEPVEGEFPDWHALSVRAPEVHLELVGLAGVWQALSAVRPGVAELPGPAGRVLIDADLLAEALLGAAPDGRVLLGLGELPCPVRLEFPDLGRVVFVMPRVTLREDLVAGVDLGAHVRPLPREAVR